MREPPPVIDVDFEVITGPRPPSETIDKVEVVAQVFGWVVATIAGLGVSTVMAAIWKTAGY